MNRESNYNELFKRIEPQCTTAYLFNFAAYKQDTAHNRRDNVDLKRIEKERLQEYEESKKGPLDRIHDGTFGKTKR